MTAALAEGLPRLRDYLAAQQTRAGLVARRLLGQPAPGDEALRQALLDGYARELRPDGSVGGSVLPTVWRLHELMDLGEDPHAPAHRATLAWVLSLDGQPGAFGQGCERDRHQHQACEHFVSGFFSAGDPALRVAPITIPSGKVFRTEAQARFALSCLALRAVFRAGETGRPSVDHHLTSLAGMLRRWTSWTGYFAPDMLIAGLHALLLSPAGPHRAVAADAIAWVVRHQAADGTWAGADLFHTLDALAAASTPEALEGIRRAVPPLFARQRAGGGFGPVASQERALIATRALHAAGLMP
ncbi:MAG: hypothetical protein ACOY71_05100 [Gemmatimonadota bacterium]